MGTEHPDFYTMNTSEFTRRSKRVRIRGQRRPQPTLWARFELFPHGFQTRYIRLLLAALALCPVLVHSCPFRSGCDGTVITKYVCNSDTGCPNRGTKYSTLPPCKTRPRNK